jgi:hypothetical protein
MKHTWLSVIAVGLAVALGSLYFSRKGDAPSSQPPIVEMDSAALSALQAEFNRTADSLRVILLLSPT